MNVVIRAASSNDIAVISEFNCCLVMEAENKTLDRKTVVEGVRRGLQLGDEVQYFVAEDESGVIGQIMINREKFALWITKGDAYFQNKVRPPFWADLFYFMSGWKA